MSRGDPPTGDGCSPPLLTGRGRPAPFRVTDPVRSLLVSLVLAAALVLPAVSAEMHVAVTGDDKGAGSAADPLRTIGEALDRVARHTRRGLESFTVFIHDGVYPVSQTLQVGSGMSGQSDAPVVVRGAPGCKPVLDGGVRLDVSRAAPVSEPGQLLRLAPVARGRVFSVSVTNATVRKLVSGGGARMSLDGRMMTLARYPNVGYAHIHRIVDKGAIYAHGRTKGAPPQSSIERPVGGVFTVRDKDIAPWEREYQFVKKARVAGYFSYDWYREIHPVASFEGGRIRLVDYSRYGILNIQKIPRRFYVNNLLCELDAPGEFYFDVATSELFFIPFDSLKADSAISVWSGPPCVEFKGVSHMRLENITVEGVGHGKAAVIVEGGNGVRVAGCTIRNCSRPAVVIEGGRNNGILSCDIYDVPHHLTLAGGDVRSLKPAGNYAENCHFTQVQAADYYGRIQVRGVGNIFRNNLVHNFVGQVMTVGDCEHVIERNEFFNIGIEEGDGGTIYSGAAMWSWGNVYRHNFLHHLMCVPQAHPRGGIYPDDHDAGDTVTENVFYKAAHRAVLLNGGAGHTVSRNLFLNGYIGIYNTIVYGDKAWKSIADFESGKQKRGDKGDHIWRTEQVVGKEGWNREPWASRYPLFAKIMNQERLRFWPIECRLTDNLFCGNHMDVQIFGGRDKPHIGQNPYVRIEGSRAIDMEVFRDPVSLDFGVNDAAAHDMPAIPFDRIGLYRDAFRTSPPDKKVYRRFARQRFAVRKSYDPNARYDPKTINDLLYWNSGKAVLRRQEY